MQSYFSHLDLFAVAHFAKNKQRDMGAGFGEGLLITCAMLMWQVNK